MDEWLLVATSHALYAEMEATKYAEMEATKYAEMEATKYAEMEATKYAEMENHHGRLVAGGDIR
jgi:3D (Asp-Asp-Asp) domain-containing protein